MVGGVQMALLQKNTARYGGNTYKYPKSNCCTCGKALRQNESVTNISTIANNDFNLSNCTLNTNTSLTYIFQIPISNYLIFFTNWAQNQSNISCVNHTGSTTNNMICRYEVDQSSIQSPICPSNNITNRYIPPNSADTEDWLNTARFSCFEYEITRRWCANGRFTSGNSWTGGAQYNYPERHCCVCGKDLLSPTQSISVLPNNNTIDSSEYGIVHLKNCSRSNSTYLFDIKCLGPLNFLNSNTTMNVTLYNCPLNCFFNWNTTQFNKKQSINVSRQFFHGSFVYYLKSKLFSQDTITCGSFIEIDTITTELPKQQPFNCNNGKIGSYCNITISTCLMTKPCLNNGTCVDTNSSFICLCPPLKFIGANCEIDIRPCQVYTCLSRGKCIETMNSASFQYQCDDGYEGVHCETMIDYCQNVQCQNNGQCRTSPLNFTCECTSTDYSGRYCETKSSALATKQTVNRSLSFIAIIAIVIVLGFIVVMDGLKYCFGIDPVRKERERIRAKQLKEQRLKKQRRRRPIVMRFIYINKPQLDPVVEIEEV